MLAGQADAAIAELLGLNSVSARVDQAPREQILDVAASDPNSETVDIDVRELRNLSQIVASNAPAPKFEQRSGQHLKHARLCKEVIKAERKLQVVVVEKRKLEVSEAVASLSTGATASTTLPLSNNQQAACAIVLAAKPVRHCRTRRCTTSSRGEKVLCGTASHSEGVFRGKVSWRY